uniref:Uncharacterized protein n=1 Tax=Rhizophora mucronata TaxID=61149 RepID=A0A2P2PKP5_RHIMU
MKTCIRTKQMATSKKGSNNSTKT